MKKTIPLLLILTAFLIKPATSQVDSLGTKFAVTDTHNVKLNLFDTDDLFEITLKFDISAYKRAKSDTTYFDALLTYFNNESDSITKKIKVRARGNIRRTNICDFPPLMLNFKMKDSVGSEFSGINKLKIVPYCQIGYESYILKEYLVYKLYNVLTDYSLKVRLFKITYINSAKDKKPITQYGFAIEPMNLFEKRTGTQQIKFTGMTQRSVKPDMLDRMAIFNYMIGNTDWSVPILHNVILFAKAKPDPDYMNLIAAYDFDYSGLVNTDYAVPFDNLLSMIQTVRDRLYMAVCRDESVFTEELKEFTAKKDAFYKVINDFPYLSPRIKKEMISYLDGFYYGIDKRNTLVKRLLSDCSWFEEQANLKVRQ
jgi:hypothetical protein